MFVYGTLMHKEHCSGWGEDAEIAPPQNATVPGTLLDYGPFPYADFDGPGVIHGQVLKVDDETVEFLYICNVERGAGYYERIVEAVLSDGTKVTCLGWQVRDIYRDLPVIESGDWNAHIALTNEVMLG